MVNLQNMSVAVQKPLCIVLRQIFWQRPCMFLNIFAAERMMQMDALDLLRQFLVLVQHPMDVGNALALH